MRRDFILIIMIFLLIIMIFLAGCATEPRVKKEKVSKMELGNQAYDAGNYMEAINYYNEWLSDHPDNADACFKVGQCYENLRDPKYYKYALEYYDRTVKINPENLLTFLHRANIYYRMNQLTNAEADLDAVVNSKGFGNLEVLHRLKAYVLDAQIKFAKSKDESNRREALKSLEQANSLALQYPSQIPSEYHLVLLYNQAMIHYHLYYFEDARRELEAYVARLQETEQEVTPDIYRKLAIIYYWCYDLDSARKIMKYLTEDDLKQLADAFEDPAFFQVQPVQSKE